MSNVFDIFDKVFCINLERSIDRKKHMEEQFSKNNIKAQFVIGVDANSEIIDEHLKNNQIVIEPEVEDLSLTSLLSEISLENLHGETEWSKARGNEVW